MERVDLLEPEADLKKEFARLNQELFIKKCDIRLKEFNKIREEFTNFFKSDPDFKVFEAGRDIVAQLNDIKITLCELEDYKKDTGLEIKMKIVISNDKEFEFFNTVYRNKMKTANTIQPISGSKDELVKSDIKYLKDFLDGKIFYVFKYKIKGENKEYSSFKELLESLCF